jgi:hypothetical protein
VCLVAFALGPIGQQPASLAAAPDGAAASPRSRPLTGRINKLLPMPV